jgi:hypothetical protein
MPAIAITKNIPVGPDKPNSRRTTEEIMIVSIVMPETGLRAVVAMAFAATEVKKKENRRPAPSPQSPEEDETERRCNDRADEHRHDRDVAVGARELDVAFPVAKCLDGDSERADHDLERLQDAEDPRGCDRAHADEPHVAAEDLVRAHRGDRLRAGWHDLRDVRPEIEDQGDENEIREYASRA